MAHDETVGGKTVDPLLVVGVSLLPSSALALGFGAAFVAPKREQTLCGVIGGCTTYRRIDDEARARGSGYVAAGIASGVVGLSAVGAGAWLSRADEDVNSGPFIPLGTWLTAIGLSTTAVGIGGLVAERGDAGTAPGAVGAIAIGGLATLGGLTTFGYGVHSWRRASYRPRSEGRLSTGIALASMAATIAAPTTLLCAGLPNARGEHAGYAFVMCLPMLLATAGLGGGGIALWTMGAANEPATDAQLSLEAGAGGLMLKGQTP